MCQAFSVHQTDITCAITLKLSRLSNTKSPKGNRNVFGFASLSAIFERMLKNP